MHVINAVINSVLILCTLIYIIVNLNHTSLQHRYLKILLFLENLPLRQV